MTPRQKRDRTRMLKTRYGLTLADYEMMFAAQNGVCAICHQTETHRSRGGRIQPLSVDHDHKTGQIRGLLCDACNKLIEAFDDNPERMQRAIELLERK